jgi:hypothetical protein
MTVSIALKTLTDSITGAIKENSLSCTSGRCYLRIQHLFYLFMSLTEKYWGTSSFYPNKSCGCAQYPSSGIRVNVSFAMTTWKQKPLVGWGIVVNQQRAQLLPHWNRARRQLAFSVTFAND